MRWVMVAIVAAGFCVGVARADLVVYQNGSTREGVVVSQDNQGVRLRQNLDGIMATIFIPKADILRVERRPLKEPTEAPATQKVETPESAPAVTPATGKGLSEPVGRGTFFSAWLQMAHFAPSRLPPLTDDQKELFEKALEAHRKSDSQLEFKALLALSQSPNVSVETLNSAAFDKVRMSFGRWLAESRWALLQTAKIRVGKFKLDDVQPVERSWLAQDFKAATPQALLPMATYLLDPTKPFSEARRAQVAALGSISVSNCLDVKEKAMWAQALLDGQLQVTPDLTEDDIKLLKLHIGNMRQVINECLKYENKARVNSNAPKH